MNVLITGGAGFIGTHLTRALLRDGHAVRILDNFLPQVHGADGRLAPDVAPHVELVRADVEDFEAVQKAVQGMDAVVHYAAETGTGQSMYEVRRYERVNGGGTAGLLEAVMQARGSGLGKLVVASSRAVYGEGAYRCPEHGTVYPATRRAEAMEAGQFEPECPVCGTPCTVVPTPEEAPFQPSSMYGLTKQLQEQMVLLYGQTLGIPAFALRYQNVYGGGQSLKNPYTGLLAVFTTLARQGTPLTLFEDGEESRDFVHVRDVVTATLAALDPARTGNAAVNVGSGARTSVEEVARHVVRLVGADVPLRTTGAFRLGDIRHNVADLSRARTLLGFAPSVAFAEGLEEFLGWALGETVEDLPFEQSLRQLAERGLYKA